MLRVGTGFDAHRFARGRDLVIGGVAIPHPVGLDGHSDADVLCHAVADALLGAMALGDIGMHFKNTDPRWKGADSIVILRTVAGKVRRAGGRPINIDATVVAEKPKIAPYVLKMRERIAKAIGLNPSRVSVKATTMEGMGAVGRAEGIVANAVAAVEVRSPRGRAGKAAK